MDSPFSIIIPLEKTGENSLTGIASATSIDRDDERMSEKALDMMVRDIKTSGVNLFGNHQHDWENTLGVVKDATRLGDKMQIDVDLDDPTTNPKIPMMKNKMARGIKLGLSVGGNVVDWKYEFSKELGKKIKVLDKVKIYEVSVVGIPSNADSFLSLGQAIAKSAKLPTLEPCPLCQTQMDELKKCPTCLFAKGLQSEIAELKSQLNNITQSDLQGVVSVMARKYGTDESEIWEGLGF